jgi:hypothetical protein
MEPQTISQTATVSIASITIDGLAGISCRTCGAPLDVCQPDPNLTDRFLATCPDCLAWSLVESTGDQSIIWMTSLDPLFSLSRVRDLRPTSP